MSYYDYVDKYLVENTETNKAYYLEVTQDKWASNPREEALESQTGVSFYIPRMPRCYQKIDEFVDKRSPVYKDYYETEKDFSGFLEEEKAKGKTILNIYCYEHGNVAFSFDKIGQFNDAFDSWKAGFAILEKGVPIEKAYDELQEFEDYLNGYVYEAHLFDYENGERIDDCGDLYAERGGSFRERDIIKVLDDLGYINPKESDKWLVHNCENTYDFEKDLLKRKLKKATMEQGE